MGGIRRRGRSHLRYGCAAFTTTTTTTTIATTAREFGQEDHGRGWEGGVEDEVSSFEEVKVEKKLED